MKRRTKSKLTRTRTRVFFNILLAIAIGSGIALAFDHFLPPSEHPLPTAGTVVKLDVGPATCVDLQACETGCGQGKGDLCRALGATYAFGQAGVAKDETRAASLYVQACDLGDTSGCVFAGQSYEYSHGVAKDDSRAVGFYNRACEGGSTAGCYNLAIMLEAGRGTKADPGRATALYRNACSAGALRACEKAGPPP